MFDLGAGKTKLFGCIEFVLNSIHGLLGIIRDTWLFRLLSFRSLGLCGSLDSCFLLLLGSLSPECILLLHNWVSRSCHLLLSISLGLLSSQNLNWFIFLWLNSCSILLDDIIGGRCHDSLHAFHLEHINHFISCCILLALSIFTKASIRIAQDVETVAQLLIWESLVSVCIKWVEKAVNCIVDQGLPFFWICGDVFNLWEESIHHGAKCDSSNLLIIVYKLLHLSHHILICLISRLSWLSQLKYVSNLMNIWFDISRNWLWWSFSSVLVWWLWSFCEFIGCSGWSFRHKLWLVIKFPWNSTS